MLLRRLYQCITLLISLAVTFAVGLGVFASNVSKLSELSGERVFYLDDSSSQGLRKEELSILDVFRVEGESVRFARAGETEDALVSGILDTYGAKVLFLETVCGTTSYYCYTGAWQNGIDLNGVTVNLHIAVSEDVCAVGTPIIFDGF